MKTNCVLRTHAAFVHTSSSLLMCSAEDSKKLLKQLEDIEEHNFSVCLAFHAMPFL